ncbi:MAG: helix-turn-helix domain-containing protein [Candidatus Thermoplasmatota archaeon]|jgi:ArsR family transcriptional regulator|nr:helix-turn-helix domain-containing protein [Candidatus Thermoplasmatota archaeon]MCL5988549.1 helix-turn-helix domain-containing protein [Candidatus Thermoplasmatota archaeon]
MSTIDDILSVLENGTRRSILRQLLLDSTYPLEISRALGVSQQAINKHLEVLMKSDMISFSGSTSNNFGPPRKIYSPKGFSTIVIDYAPGFLEVNNYPLDDPGNVNNSSGEITMDNLIDVNSKLDSLMEERKKLVEEKNRIIKGLRNHVIQTVHDMLIRDILLEYIQTLDISKVAERFGLDENTASLIVGNYIF